MSASENGSNMSGVWEMLNAVKKRRAEAETTARQQGRDEAARKRAHQFFEHMITNLVEARIFQDDEGDDDDVDNDDDNTNGQQPPKDDVANVLSEFDRYCDDTPELNQLVRTYTVVARDEPLKQLAAVNKMLADGTKAIESANESMKQANRITKGLSGLM